MLVGQIEKDIKFGLYSQLFWSQINKCLEYFSLQILMNVMTTHAENLRFVKIPKVHTNVHAGKVSKEVHLLVNA